MSIKFIIHPLAHLVLLALEIFGMNLAVEIFTKQVPDRERFVKGSLITAGIIFLLDMFVFNFYKSIIRTVILLFIMFLNFKYVNQVSFKKCAIQTGVVLLVMIFVEGIMMLFINLIFADAFDILFKNYVFMYGLYLCFFYLMVIIGSTFNISIIKLQKYNF